MKMISLTESEIKHLLYLLEVNEREALTHGRADHWWIRHEKIKMKLKRGIDSAREQE